MSDRAVPGGPVPSRLAVRTVPRFGFRPGSWLALPGFAPRWGNHVRHWLFGRVSVLWPSCRPGGGSGCFVAVGLSDPCRAPVGVPGFVVGPVVGPVPGGPGLFGTPSARVPGVASSVFVRSVFVRFGPFHIRAPIDGKSIMLPARGGGRRRPAGPAHDSADDGVLVELISCLEVKRADSYDHIAVNLTTCAVNAKTSVGVSVKGNAAVETVCHYVFSERAEVGRAATAIYVSSVGFCREHVNVRAKLTEELGGGRTCRAVSAVDGYIESFEIATGGGFDVINIFPCRA